ncbi:MAG TPA: hypothetical protein PLH31_04075, partial [Caulobacter sp.]|nr:hypothetical protein [Caulobacter sp.]
MSRVAIFVDAGYFLTQGSVTITGSKQARSELRLNGAAAQAALIQFAREKSDNARLLRTYWYDAQLRTGPT